MGRLNLGRRAADESGSATIETVLWMPVFVFILTLIFDTSMVFLNKAEILQEMRNANRAFSIGQASLQETETRVRSFIEARGAEANVASTLQGTNIRTDVSLRAGDLGGVGFLQRIARTEMRLSSQHMVEG